MSASSRAMKDAATWHCRFQYSLGLCLTVSFTCTSTAWENGFFTALKGLATPAPRTVFQDDDEAWLALRYDLTAPLARYVAENYQDLPKPYRSYRSGWVFRNEKPGPGRYRQFMQFDADTVGTSSPAAGSASGPHPLSDRKASSSPRSRHCAKRRATSYES